MRENSTKKKKKGKHGRGNRKIVAFAVVVTLIFVVVLAVLILQEEKENRVLDRNAEAIQESIDEEKAIQESLTEKEGRALTAEEIIRIARSRYGLVFPNEIILVPQE